MLRRHVIVFGIMALSAFVGPAAAQAQEGSVEIGVDAEFAYHIIDNGGDDIFQVAIPFGGGLIDLPRARNGLRIGFFASDAVSIEPSISLSLLSDGDDTFWQLGLGTALLFHLQTDRDETRPYLGVGGSLSTFGNGDTASQLSVSGEAGFKFPVQNSFGLRLGAGVGRFFENDDFNGRTSIYATFGFSYFTG